AASAAGSAGPRGRALVSIGPSPKLVASCDNSRACGISTRRCRLVETDGGGASTKRGGYALWSGAPGGGSRWICLRLSSNGVSRELIRTQAGREARQRQRHGEDQLCCQRQVRWTKSVDAVQGLRFHWSDATRRPRAQDQAAEV